MNRIRRAHENDLARIAEIEIFNYRLYFYPIFRSDAYYFGELQVPALMEVYRNATDYIWVYDDGVVKGFIWVEGKEIRKLFVEPVLHSCGVGAQLLDYAIRHMDADTLWALEKNARAVAFYKRHGFCVTDERKPEEDTSEYLVRLVLPRSS